MMVRKFFTYHTAITLLISLCILLFYPLTRNANLIKELLWWFGFPIIVGVFLLLSNSGQALSIINRIKLFFNTHKPLIFVLIIFFIWNIIQTFRSIDKMTGTLYLLRLFGFYLVFLSFVFFFSKRKHYYTIMEILSYVLLISSLYVLVQWAGYDFVNWSDKRRPPGTFGNPNFTADCLSCFFPIILIWELIAKKSIKFSRGDYTKFFPKIFKLKNFPYKSLIILFSIITTQSRSGLIGLLSGFAVLGILFSLIVKNLNKFPMQNIKIKESSKKISETQKIYSYLKNIYPLRIILIGILIIVLFIGIIFWFAPEKLSHIFSSTTVQLRILIWKGCMLLWNENFWGGWGLGGFDVASQKIKYLAEPIAGTKIIGHAHNWILESLVEHGLIGTVFFIYLLLKIINIFIKKIKASKDLFQALLLSGITGSVAALLFENLVDVWLNWWDGSILLWFLLGLGVSTSLLRERRNAILHKKPISKILIKILGISFILVGVVLGFFLFKIFQTERVIFNAQNYIFANRHKEAFEILKEADEDFPPLSMVRFFKIFCLLNLKQFDEAERMSNILFEKQPLKSQSHMLLAQLHALKGKYDIAMTYYKKAYEIEPSSENAIALSKIYLAKSDLKNALSVLQGQLKKIVYPPLLKFYLKIENDLKGTKNARDFIANLRENQSYVFILKDNSKAELARWEGELSYLLKEYGRAIYCYNIALMLNPKDFQIWNDFGLVLKDTKWYERADLAFQRGEKLAPNNYAPKFNRLELAIIMKNYLLAKEMAEKLKNINLPEQGKLRLKDINESILPAMSKNQ